MQANNFSKSKAIRLKIKYPSEFRNKLQEIIFTRYNQPYYAATYKEDLMKRLFEQFGYDYSRTAVKEIYYAEYKAKGGHREFEEYTNWIFSENNS